MSLPETDLARVRRWAAAKNERIGEHIDGGHARVGWQAAGRYAPSGPRERA